MIWLSLTSTVSDNKIQISILILRRGALSSSPCWWYWWWWYWLMDSMRRSESDREERLAPVRGCWLSSENMRRSFSLVYRILNGTIFWSATTLSHTLSITRMTNKSWCEHHPCVKIFTKAISAELNTKRFILIFSWLITCIEASDLSKGCWLSCNEAFLLFAKYKGGRGWYWMTGTSLREWRRRRELTLLWGGDGDLALPSSWSWWWFSPKQQYVI